MWEELHIIKDINPDNLLICMRTFLSHVCCKSLQSIYSKNFHFLLNQTTLCCNMFGMGNKNFWIVHGIKVSIAGASHHQEALVSEWAHTQTLMTHAQIIFHTAQLVWLGRTHSLNMPQQYNEQHCNVLGPTPPLSRECTFVQKK